MTVIVWATSVNQSSFETPTCKYKDQCKENFVTHYPLLFHKQLLSEVVLNISSRISDYTCTYTKCYPDSLKKVPKNEVFSQKKIITS